MSARIRRGVLLGASLVLTLFLASAGIAWYFSGLALAVTHTVDRAEVASSNGSGVVKLTRDHYALLPGRYGLEWAGGYASVGGITGTDTATVTRSYTPGATPLAANTPVSLDVFAYSGDPSSALGLAFQDVSINGELGNLPAWYVPAGSGAGAGSGAAHTWVIFVHGHNTSRRESLRYLSALHGFGLPVLVPTYRGDVGAPRNKDGWNHLGDTEWRDIDASLRWALAHGARDVVLFGNSMGGAVSLQVTDRSPEKASIRGLVLDSPVIDWRSVLRHQGADRHLPGPVSDLAIWTIEERAGIDFDAFDWVSRAGELRVPTLLFHSDDDTYVPDGPAKRLAALRPDLVTLDLVPGADHTREWNVDPQAYTATLQEWLQRQGALD